MSDLFERYRAQLINTWLALVALPLGVFAVRPPLPVNVIDLLLTVVCLQFLARWSAGHHLLVTSTFRPEAGWHGGSQAAAQRRFINLGFFACAANAIFWLMANATHSPDLFRKTVIALLLLDVYLALFDRMARPRWPGVILDCVRQLRAAADLIQFRRPPKYSARTWVFNNAICATLLLAVDRAVGLGLLSASSALLLLVLVCAVNAVVDVYVTKSLG